MTDAPRSGTPRRWQGMGVRLVRLALLGAVVWLLRSGHSMKAEALSAERVHDFFPAAASLSEPDLATGVQSVRDASGQVIGMVAQTLPEAAGIIGYAGPTNTLIAMDPKGAVLGVRILHSEDTPDHVSEVVSQRKFFAQFKDMHMGETQAKRVDGVSGATLTSSAMAEGILRKLGTQGPSLRFPEEITLVEVRDLEAKAQSLRRSTVKKDHWEVLDGEGKIIGFALRTSPVSDGVVGYKGPTDTLVLMDAQGEKVRGIRLRKSFDTKRYVGYVRDDSYFLNRFNGMTLQKLAGLDINAEKIEGVSGASETSYAVVDGLRKRAQALVDGGAKSKDWALGIRWRWQDTGHVLVLLSALLMAFTRMRGFAWARHLHHALLVGYMGLFAGEMLSQSLLTGWARHGVPWSSAAGLALLGVVALLGPVLTRRQLYCHHVCPHGALQQLVARRLPWQIQVPARVSRWLEKLPFVLLAAVVFIVALGLSFDLNSLEPFDAYLWRVAGRSALAVAIVGLLASLFIPLAYCKYGCPTGAVFKLLRFAGDGDRLGRREWLAAAVIAGAAGLRWWQGV